MSRLARLATLAACAALLSPAVAAGHPARQPMSNFDVARANGPAETLALCDLTAFLMTRPDLNADVIYAPELPFGPRFWRPLRHPYFRPMDMAVDEKVHDAALRLESAGVVTRSQVADARARFDVGMFDSYRTGTQSDRLFLEDQARRCDGLMNEFLHRPVAELRAAAGRG